MLFAKSYIFSLDLPVPPDQNCCQSDAPKLFVHAYVQWWDCFLRRSPIREKIRGIIDPPTWGGDRGLVIGVFDCGPTGRPFESASCRSTLTPPPVFHDWVNKGLGMSNRGHVCIFIKDPLPLIEKSRVSCPGGRFPPSFIHRVINISGLNKLYDCMFSP